MPLGIAAGGGPEDAPAGARAGAAGERRQAPVPPARAPAGHLHHQQGLQQRKLSCLLGLKGLLCDGQRVSDNSYNWL